MRSREIFVLVVLAWLAFRRSQEGTANVTLIVTEPGLEGTTLAWPP